MKKERAGTIFYRAQLPGSVENITGTLTTTAFSREMDNYSFIPTRGMPHRGTSVLHEHRHITSLAWW